MRQAWLGAILAVLCVVGLGGALAIHSGWFATSSGSAPTLGPLASEPAFELAPPVLPVEVEEETVVVPAEALAPPRASVAAPPDPLPASEAEASPVESEVAGPSLDELMRVPGAPPPEGQDVDWVGRRSEAPPAEGRKPRARIDYSRENLTRDVPNQDERRRTDVGVSVPVDPKERLRVKGGVRVDERDVSKSETESETTPTVGVEVRF